MLTKSSLSVAFVFCFALSCLAQEETKPMPGELELLKTYVGVWDAEIEVWPQGLESPSTKFKGVETNRPYGKHWIASDFDSHIGGQTLKVHSIVGYDLDQRKMVGKVVDHGPYMATMTGTYDKESKTLTWMTNAKDLNGNPIVQKTHVTQKSESERELVLMVPGSEKDKFKKFMQIKYVKRK